MNLQKAQQIIDEIQAVCHTHGVVLIGRHISDGSFGEIQILEPNDLKHDEIEHLSSGDKPYKHNGLTLVNGIT